MGLPSQSQRVTAGRAVTFRSKRRKRRGAPRVVAVVVAVGLIVVLGWVLTAALGGPGGDQGGNHGGDQIGGGANGDPSLTGEGFEQTPTPGGRNNRVATVDDPAVEAILEGIEDDERGTPRAGESRRGQSDGRSGGLLAGALRNEREDTTPTNGTPTSQSNQGGDRPDDRVTRLPEPEQTETPGTQARTNDSSRGGEATQTNPAQTSPAQTSPAQTSPAQTNPAQTNPAQTNPAQTNPAQTNPAQTNPAQTNPAQTNPAQTNPAQTNPATTQPSAPRVADAIAQADRVLADASGASDQALLDARRAVLRELASARRDRSASRVRAAKDRVARLNEIIVFSPRVVEGDTLTSVYRVQSGDSLARISSRSKTQTHWRLIQRVNGLANPNRIRVGQRLKLVQGPFHAVVQKGSFTMDVYSGPSSSPAEWQYVRSFQVGLGEGGSTPTGTFVVSDNKLENPGWVNPRDSRERYTRDDPKNPIGEYWLGLDGVGSSEGVTGYGIHGTIDPESIGTNASMGCVRLADGDIELVYELLDEQVSVVHIVD